MQAARCPSGAGPPPTMVAPLPRVSFLDCGPAPEYLYQSVTGNGVLRSARFGL